MDFKLYKIAIFVLGLVAMLIPANNVSAVCSTNADCGVGYQCSYGGECIPQWVDPFDEGVGGRVSTEQDRSSAGLRGAGGFLSTAARRAGFPAAEQQPEVVIGRIIKGLILVIGVIFGLLVIYGGYLWMIARGNEEMVKKAKGILETAVIGIILVVGAYAITSYVVERVIGAAYVPPGSQGASPR